MFVTVDGVLTDNGSTEIHHAFVGDHGEEDAPEEMILLGARCIRPWDRELNRSCQAFQLDGRLWKEWDKQEWKGGWVRKLEKKTQGRKEPVGNG